MSKQLEDRIASLVKERDQARNEALELAARDDFNEDDDTFKGLEERALKLDGQVKKLTELLTAQQAADVLEAKFAKGTQTRAQINDRPLDPGKAFVDSDQWRSYNGSGRSSTVEWGIEERALPNTLATFQDVLNLGANRVEDATTIYGAPRYLPFLNQVPVSTNTVDVVTYTKAAGGAAVVAEGANKPSVEYTASVEPKTLDTIAVWTQMSRQLAEDSAAVRATVNNLLVADIMAKLDAEAGAGLIAGIPGAATAIAPAGSGIVGEIRAGKSYLRNTLGLTADSFMIRESDLIELDIAMSAQTNSAPTAFNYWGLAPLEVPDTTPGIAAGQVVVMAARQSVNHYSRSTVQTYATDSHASTFIANILTLLSEARAKTMVIRPSGLLLVDEVA